MEKKNLEEKMRSEGKSFAPNVLGKVYEKLGLEFSNAKNQVVENKLKEEGKILVQNRYDEVKASIPEKKKIPGFLLFIKNPITISVTASVLVGVITTSILVPVLVNRYAQGAGLNETNAVATDNTVSLNLTSASKSYSAKMKYVVNTEGKVEEDKIIALDDNSAYLINKYDTVPATSKASIAKDTNYLSFTNKYLETALNYGYLEKIKSSANTIVFTISSSKGNDKRFKELKEELEDSLLSFIEENKVIIDYTIEEEQVDIYSLFDEEDYEKASLIIDMYNLSSRLFVGSERTLSEAYFSDDLNDWANHFKNTSLELLNEYVDMLTFLNDKIVGEEKRDLLIDIFYEESDMFLNDVKLFNSYLPIMEAREKAIKEYLAENGSDAIKAVLDNQGALFEYLNKFAKRPNERIQPDSKVDYTPATWDIFDKGFYVFNQNNYNPHGRVDVRSFKELLEKVYNNTTEFGKTEEDLYYLYYDLFTLLDVRQSTIYIIDDNYFSLIDAVSGFQFMMDWNDEDYCHNHEEPHGWDEDFDEWWDSNHGHKGGGHH